MLSVTLFQLLYTLISISWTVGGADVSGSNIATFEDDSCAKSLDNINGPNGYPDGTCTSLNLEPVESFQVVGLDLGCMVTIYGNDTDPATPCSSDTKILAEIATCYNSTWIYYSIDGCTRPSNSSSSSTSTSLVSSSSSPPTLSSTSSVSHSATPAPTNTALPAPTNSSDPDRQKKLIVGGIVGGISGLALICIAALLCMRRRYKKQAAAHPFPPSYELSEQSSQEQLSPPEKAAHAELYSYEVPLEIGSRRSVEVAAVELPGEILADADKRGPQPTIKVHLAS